MDMDVYITVVRTCDKRRCHTCQESPAHSHCVWTATENKSACKTQINPITRLASLDVPPFMWLTHPVSW